MPDFTREIKSYRVAHFAGNAPMYRAWIVLRDVEGKAVGWAFFHRDPATIPSACSMANGYVECRYSWENFPHVLDLLRNENAVYVRYVESLAGNKAVIDTSAEPVGEGEM